MILAAYHWVIQYSVEIEWFCVGYIAAQAIQLLGGSRLRLRRRGHDLYRSYKVYKGYR